MSKPNIVFILPDQLRADYLGCYGADFVSTPNIDTLANGGTQYERAYAPCPLCVPSRAGMLTGLSPWEHGVFSNRQWLRPDYQACGIRTWPEILAEQGYRTAAIGKMHFTPWDASMGFGERIIAEDKRHIHIEDDYADYLRSKGMKKRHASTYGEYRETLGAFANDLEPEDQIDAWVARRASEWIEEQDPAQPFGLMVGLPSPHDPYDPDPSELARICPDLLPDSTPPTEETRQLRPGMLRSFREPWSDLDYEHFPASAKCQLKRHYAALVHHVDAAVGEVVRAVERSVGLDNTIILFASDHGDFLGDFDLIGKRYFYEPSVHVPLIVRGPGFAADRERRVVSLTDIYATIAAAADPRFSDGIPTLQEPLSERILVGALDCGLWATDGSWKLSVYDGGPVVLTDLESDPCEQVNLATDQYAQGMLQRLYEAIVREVIRATPRGHADKRVQSVGDITSRDYGSRGWRRGYPASLTT